MTTTSRGHDKDSPDRSQALEIKIQTCPHGLLTSPSHSTRPHRSKSTDLGTHITRTPSRSSRPPLC